MTDGKIDPKAFNGHGGYRVTDLGIEGELDEGDRIVDQAGEVVGWNDENLAAVKEDFVERRDKIKQCAEAVGSTLEPSENLLNETARALEAVMKPPESGIRLSPRLQSTALLAKSGVLAKQISHIGIFEDHEKYKEYGVFLGAGGKKTFWGMKSLVVLKEAIATDRSNTAAWYSYGVALTVIGSSKTKTEWVERNIKYEGRPVSVKEETETTLKNLVDFDKDVGSQYVALTLLRVLVKNHGGKMTREQGELEAKLTRNIESLRTTDEAGFLETQEVIGKYVGKYRRDP